jgi:hypothetical protein
VRRSEGRDDLVSVTVRDSTPLLGPSLEVFRFGVPGLRVVPWASWFASGLFPPLPPSLPSTTHPRSTMSNPDAIRAQIENVKRLREAAEAKAKEAERKRMQEAEEEERALEAKLERAEQDAKKRKEAEQRKGKGKKKMGREEMGEMKRKREELEAQLASAAAALKQMSSFEGTWRVFNGATCTNAAIGTPMDVDDDDDDASSTKGSLDGDTIRVVPKVEPTPWQYVEGKGRCLRCLKDDRQCRINLQVIEKWRLEHRQGKVFARAPDGANCESCRKAAKPCELPASEEMRRAIVSKAPRSEPAASQASTAPSMASSSKRRVEAVVEVPRKRIRAAAAATLSEGQYRQGVFARLDRIAEAVEALLELEKRREQEMQEEMERRAREGPASLWGSGGVASLPDDSDVEFVEGIGEQKGSDDTEKAASAGDEAGAEEGAEEEGEEVEV